MISAQAIIKDNSIDLTKVIEKASINLKAPVILEKVSLTSKHNDEYDYDHQVSDKTPVVTIEEGAKQEIVADSGSGVRVKANGNIADFVELRINGEKIDLKNYKLESGSTIVTLTKEYIDIISSGTYNMTFVYTNGEVTTNFSIVNATSNIGKVTNNLKTGDNIVKFISIFVIAFVALVVMQKIKKKVKND